MEGAGRKTGPFFMGRADLKSHDPGWDASVDRRFSGSFRHGNRFMAFRNDYEMAQPVRASCSTGKSDGYATKAIPIAFA